MSRRLADAGDELVAAELDIRERLGARPLDFTSMTAVSNVYRAASTVRNHMEASVLTEHGLSWAAFTVLWVLWIWGPHETSVLAHEAGVTKGTLTGVLNTLERDRLVRRARRADDARRIVVTLTAAGTRRIERVFPLFNAQEGAVCSPLTATERLELARLLRKLMRGVDALATD